MIAFLRGKIIFKEKDFIIIDVNGVGYKVFLSPKTYSKVQQGDFNVNLFCHLHIRENCLDLYGFLDREELEVFNVLNAIRGIGPKHSLKMASLGSLDVMRKAVSARDVDFFKGVPGIGKKRIQKIILELTGKFKDDFFDNSKRGAGAQKNTAAAVVDKSAIAALVNFGFTEKESEKALRSLPSNIKDVGEKVRAALKALGRI